MSRPVSERSPLSGFYLGLDSSTQSLTAVVIDIAKRTIVHQARVDFDRELSHWGTVGGQLPNQDPRIGHAPPLLWVEALERILERLTEQGAPLGQLAGVSVSGQQHGSVYLSDKAPRVLSELAAGQPLAAQLKVALSREISPIWTDSSTSEECAQLRTALGGVEACARLTGSDIFERFTGPQIKRFAQQQSNAYADTSSIALVSSFMTSILCGRIAPIDWGDGSGMNLMDIERRDYSKLALQATAPRLGERMPDLIPPWTDVGPVAPWLVARYGVPATCRVTVGSGDNPSSLIGLGLVEDDQAAISFGTSDTFFQTGSAQGTAGSAAGQTVRVDPSGAAHIFIAPTGAPMALLCFRNGSLARERVRDHFELDWQAFSQLSQAARTARGAGAERTDFFFPWFEPEIVPRGAHGVRTFGDLDWHDPSPASAGKHCLAVLETQALSMRFHSRFMQVQPDRIVATGGGSQSSALLQITADVFQAVIETVETPDSAALGAALRAAHGTLNRAGSKPVPWSDVLSGFYQPRRTVPDPGLEALYDRALEALETHLRSLL